MRSLVKRTLFMLMLFYFKKVIGNRGAVIIKDLIEKVEKRFLRAEDYKLIMDFVKDTYSILRAKNQINRRIGGL